MASIGTIPQIGVAVENMSGEDIPPRSVVLVTGVETSSDNRLTWSKVTKYDGSAGNIMVTGPGVIPATMVDGTGETVNGRGTAYYDDFIYVSIDPASTPAAGDVYGPVEGQWYIGPDGNGFVAQGEALADSDPLRCQFYRGGGGDGNFVEGRLLTAITPATNSLTGATTFSFVKFVIDNSIDPQTDPLTLKEQVNASDEIVETTGVNRSTTLSASPDAYVHCKKINREWRPSPVEDICSE